MSRSRLSEYFGIETVGSSRAVLCGMVLTIGGSLALRIIGIRHGLPEVYEHDEIHGVITALRHGTGDFSPPNFIGHGSLTEYLLLVAFGLYYGLGRLWGFFSSAEDVVAKFVEDPTLFYLIGRTVIALMGTLIVWAVYAAGARLYDRTTGLMAAIFVGVSTLHVNMSHVIKEDIVATAFVVLGFLLICRGVQRVEHSGTAGLGLYAGAGFMIGLGICAKYSAAPALIWLAILSGFESVKWFQGGQGALKSLGKAGQRMAVGLFAAIGGFFAGQPYALVRFREFLSDAVSAVSQYSTTVITNPDGLGSPYIYLMRFLPYSLGVALTLAVGVGCINGLRAGHRRRFTLLVSFPVLLFVVLFQRSAFPSFITPAIPFLALIAASVVGRISAVQGSWRWLAIAVGFGLAVQPLLSSLRYDRYVSAPDTRRHAKAWIEANIPAGETIAVEGAVFEMITFGPPLKATRAVLEAELAGIKKRQGTGRLWEAQIRASERDPNPRYALCKVVELTESVLEACKVRYAVVVTDRDDRTWGLIPHSHGAFLHALKSRYVLLKQFDPYPGVKFLHSHHALREEFPRLAMVGIFRNPSELVTGPRIRVFRRLDRP